jgi:branched-chain amino acid transport system permease protein
MGFTPLILAFVALLIGGSFGVSGVYTAAIGVGVVRELMTICLPIAWRDGALFLALLLLLLLQPRAVWSTAREEVGG